MQEDLQTDGFEQIRWAAPRNATSMGWRIAMELRTLLLLLLCFPGGLQAQTPDAQEIREGSTLHIKCPYTAQTTYETPKAWRRIGDGRRELLAEVTYNPRLYTSQVTKGRVTIEDNPVLETVSINMTDLQAEDSGTYSCAYRPYRYTDYYVPLKTISLNVFQELHRQELDSLSVQCKYSASVYSTSVYSTIAWCRRDQTGCKNWVTTDDLRRRTNKKALEGKVWMRDNTWERTVTITMQRLQARDTGVYWCALYRNSQPSRIMEVRLSVSKRTKGYVAKASGNVSVQCQYNATEYWHMSKAWCKEGGTKPCIVMVDTNMKYSGNHRARQQGRVTIQDDTQRGIVTVTMEKLQVQDSGVYWCALYEQSHLTRMVEVTLNVSEELAGETLSGSADPSQGIPSDNTTASSSNTDTFILSGVLSILFILALTSSIILYVRWRKQPKGRGNGQAEAIYEKPEDIAQPGSTERVGSPKDGSEDLKYATLNFKFQPSPEDTLYCNIEPGWAHRKPKDEEVEYTILAFKQLPTNDKG